MKLALAALLVLAARPALAEPPSLESAAGAPALARDTWDRHLRLGPLTEKLHRLGFTKVLQGNDEEIWRSCAPRGELVLCMVVDTSAHEDHAFVKFRAFARDGAYLSRVFITPAWKHYSGNGGTQTGDFSDSGSSSFSANDLMAYLNDYKESGRFSTELFTKESPQADAWIRALEARYAAARAAYAAAAAAVAAHAPEAFDGISSRWTIGNESLRISISKNGLHSVAVEIRGPRELYLNANYDDAAAFAPDAGSVAALLADMRAKRRRDLDAYFPNRRKR